MKIVSEIISVTLASIAIAFVIALFYPTSFSPLVFKVGTGIGVISLGLFSWGFWKTRV